MKLLLPLSVFLLSFGAPLSAEPAVLANPTERFTLVGKKAIPTVVSIKVEYGPAEKEGDEANESQEITPDDLFRRFFGDQFTPFGRKRDSTPRFGQGSGVIVSKDGVILTNNHVVQDSKSITVQLEDGREFEAKVLGKDPQTDLAVIKIDGTDFPYSTLGDSSALQIGQEVVAIGNPLGLRASMTQGIVSATGRANLDIANFEDFIQTDAAINRGNSGGPLLNLSGEVVGINTAIASNTGGYMGIGFAIPSNMAKEILRQILDKGSVVRGFLGVSLQPITSDLAQAFGLKKVEGALVADVSPGSPAAAAGLKSGDIILSFNGKTVEAIPSFRNQISLMAPGTEVKLDVKRGDEIQKVVLTLGTHPESEEKKAAPELAPSTFGMTVEKLTPELAKTFGYADAEGVVVTKVDPKGAAALLGIKKGALILAVNQKKVTTPEAFNEATSQKDSRGGILLHLKQDGAVRYVYMKGSK